MLVEELIIKLQKLDPKLPIRVVLMRLVKLSDVTWDEEPINFDITDLSDFDSEILVNLSDEPHEYPAPVSAPTAQEQPYALDSKLLAIIHADAFRDECEKVLKRSIYCPGCGAKLASQTPGIPRHAHANCPKLIEWVALG